MKDGDQLDVFSVRNEVLHKEIRRNISRAYTPRLLSDVEPFVDDCTTLFVQKLRSFGPSKVFDIDRWIKCYIFDTSGEIAVRTKPFAEACGVALKEM